MPEGSSHSAVLIATSWQALNRASSGRLDTQLCDCTVVVLFAGFYVEAYLNYIVSHIHRTSQMATFLNRRHPGLQDKLAWFYNEFVAKRKAPTRKNLYARNITLKLRRRFPGFAMLYRFRNDLSHGVINTTARSLDQSQRLRHQAKDMVNDLLRIVEKAGYSIPRTTNYYDAIK